MSLLLSLVYQLKISFVTGVKVNSCQKIGVEIVSLKLAVEKKALKLVLNVMTILVKILLFFVIIRTILSIKNMSGVLI